jgi:glycosyltransferase involved in cell wall biosynthesis
MTSNLVSVVIPTFNRAHIISQCLKSVFDQTYKNFEVIIVDDCSTDDTEKIVKEQYGKKVTWLKHTLRKGAAAARNTGIRASGGNYIAFQDSDDEWLPGKLEAQMRIFAQAPSQVGVVYTKLNKVIRGRNYEFPPRNTTTTNGMIHDALLRRSLVGTPTSVIRKKCFEKTGLFDETFPRLQDWELFIRLSKHFEFRLVDEPLLTVRERDDSLSADSRALIKAIELLLEKHTGDFNSGPRTEIAKRYYRLGRMLCAESEFSGSRPYFLKAIQNTPFDLSLGLLYLSTYAGKDVHRTLWNCKNYFMPKRAGTI